MIDGEGTQADEAARGSSTDPNDRPGGEAAAPATPSSSSSRTETTTTSTVKEETSTDWPEGDPRWLGEVGEVGEIGEAGDQWAGLGTPAKEEPSK